MKMAHALLSTIGILAVWMAGAIYVHPAIGYAIFFGTSMWAGWDAHRMGLSRYKLGGPTSVASTVLGCLLLWVVVFPWYLINRGKIRSGKAERKDGRTPPASVSEVRMKSFQVTGVQTVDRKSVETVIEADTAGEAIALAEARGIEVGMVTQRVDQRARPPADDRQRQSVTAGPRDNATQVGMHQAAPVFGRVVSGTSVPGVRTVITGMPPAIRPQPSARTQDLHSAQDRVNRGGGVGPRVLASRTWAAMAALAAISVLVVECILLFTGGQTSSMRMSPSLGPVLRDHSWQLDDDGGASDGGLFGGNKFAVGNVWTFTQDGRMYSGYGPDGGGIMAPTPGRGTDWSITDDQLSVSGRIFRVSAEGTSVTLIQTNTPNRRERKPTVQDQPGLQIDMSGMFAPRDASKPMRFTLVERKLPWKRYPARLALYLCGVSVWLIPMGGLILGRKWGAFSRLGITLKVAMCVAGLSILLVTLITFAARAATRQTTTFESDAWQAPMVLLTLYAILCILVLSIIVAVRWKRPTLTSA